MEKLSTLEGFNFDGIIDDSRTPEGFSIEADSSEEIILITIEDRRGHPDFSGDRSADEWPCILQILARIGLDPAKAVVSLGCRNEAIRAGGKTTYNIGVVRFGWACATAHDPTRDRAPAPAPARALGPAPAFAQSFS